MQTAVQHRSACAWLLAASWLALPPTHPPSHPADHLLTPLPLPQEAGAPWKEPFTLSLPELSLEGLNSSISSIAGGVKELADDFQEAPTLTKGLLTAGAVVGASVLLFSQVPRLVPAPVWPASLAAAWPLQH